MLSIAESWEKKGIEKGQRNLVRRLLEKKFGALSEATISRLEGANDDELSRYADRVLDAERLEDVFA